MRQYVRFTRYEPLWISAARNVDQREIERREIWINKLDSRDSKGSRVSRDSGL